MRFYSRLGWKVLEHAKYRGESVVIMLHVTGTHTNQLTNKERQEESLILGR